MTRFMSDAYCKGIVRGHAECSNLRCYATEDPASAERITTTQYVSFPGHDLLRYTDLAAKAETERAQRVTATTLGTRGTACKQRQVAQCNVAEFYARRRRDSPCWFLSAYEFLLYWEVVPTRVPRNWREWQESRAEAWDVILTEKGEQKLKAANAPEAPSAVRLIPGVDTKLRTELPQGYLAFEDCSENARVRSAWLLRGRRRPRCPTFGHCPIPRYQQEEHESNSVLCLVYFRPWTGMPSYADDDVISIHDFRDAHVTWEATFRTWLQQIACEETKKHVSNFLSVYRVRSLAADIENSDNEGEDDTRVHVDAANLCQCLKTRETMEGQDEYEDIEATWQAHAREPDVTREGLPQETNIDTRVILTEARADDKEKAHLLGGVRNPTEAGMMPGRIQKTLDEIDAWLRELPNRRNEAGRRICNDEQHAFIERVANRVKREMQTGEAYSGCFKTDEEPLRWMLHGGPGTGKTHAINILRDELFQGLLQWEAGIHFQCAALQAVTADMLDGDTLHHVFGLSFGDTSKRTSNETKVRWLIIDEISMVSLELLAHAKPFGGLNVIILGVPHEWLMSKYARNKPAVAHGQELLWGGAQECQRERLSRKLVAEGPADVRYRQPFATAAAIFPTNVRKCHALKVRAEAYAEAAKQDRHCIIAQDKACAAVLHEKAELATEKLAWLQRHDRERGDLCGVLPLCKGMPVYLTEHINRKRLLLKGRRGKIVSWKQASQRPERINEATTVWNELPEVVYVHFPSGRWHFKGQTLTAGVIADLVLDRKTEPFQHGDHSFREYLLRHLRGERLDWPTILATYGKVKTCSECKAARRMSDLSEAQKKQPENVAVCKEVPFEAAAVDPRAPTGRAVSLADTNDVPLWPM
ncbi:PIF2, partial [Symbiodinium sp. CCMP2456]